MQAPFNALIKHYYHNIKAKSSLASLVIISLLFGQLLPVNTFFSQAAETISTSFHAFNYTYPSVQDITNSPPGLVLRRTTPFGYFVNITNNSSIFSANDVTATIELPSLTAFDITTGGMTTYTDLECSYVIAADGTLDYNIDFNTLGTPCTVSYISGTNVQLTGSDNIPVGQAAYYRLTGMSTKASYGFMPFVFAAKGSAQVTFNGSPGNIDPPINSFVKVGEATITGNIFYDNGPNGDADNGSHQTSEPLVTTSNSVVVMAVAGLQAYSAPVDNMGNYTITIPENNELGSLAYTISVPTLPINFRLTSGLSSSVVLDHGGIFNLDIGINNQTDLALNINATLPPGAEVGTTAMINVTLNNFGPTDATNVQVSIPESGPHYSLASSSPGGSNSYNSGVWTLPYLGGGTSQVFSMIINLDSAGTVDITAEIIGMGTPISTFGSPDQDSTPNNHIIEDDQMNIAFVINDATIISGFVFEDRLENGTYNGPGEDPNFPDVTVNLYDITGTPALIDTVQTDNNGNYTFSEGLESGRSYRTEVILPNGYVTTTNNLTQEFTIFLAGDYHSASFIGLFHSGTISGQVFLDANGNNIRDNNEHGGVEGILVELINGSGATVASQITDQDGEYSFPNLHASGYILQFHAFNQYLFAEPNIGPTNNDSDVIAGSGYTTILPIFSNTFLQNIDAGLHTATAELSITKTANRTEVLVGDTVTYTINVQNGGPLHSSGSVVTDLLPNGLTYISHSVSGGSFNPNNGQWILPDMAGNTEVQLEIVTTANAIGTIHNVASFSTLAQLDNNASNNSAYYDITVLSSGSPSPTPTSSPSPSASPTSAIPILHIEKYAYINNNETIIESSTNTNGPTVTPGNELMYQIAIVNTGSGIAQNINVTDSLPSSLASGWNCTYSPNDSVIGHDQQKNLDFDSNCQITGTGAITNLPSNLPSNSTLVIQLSGKTVPNLPGVICNLASVGASLVATLSDQACFTVTAPQLVIQKSANTNQVIPGGTVTYSLTVTNSGNAAANNVSIIDDLANSSLGTNIIPSCVLSTRQITLLDNGQFLNDSPNTASWSIGTLAAGASSTVRLQVEIRSDLTSAITCNNTAVTSGTNVSTTQDSAVVNIPAFTPAGAIITFNKAALNSSNNHIFNPGDHVQYRLTVSNSGTQNSELLSIHDAGNSPYLLNNIVQNSGGIVTSLNPLQITDLLVSGGRNHIINYDTTIADTDHFPLNAFRLHKNADKSDRDFYPERVEQSRLRGNSIGSASDILKAPDGQAVTLGSRGSITVNTNRNGKLVVDGDGDDFCLATLSMSNGAKYRVSVGQSNDDADFEELGTSSGRNNCFDLSDADMAWANYIKVEDQSPNTTTNSTSIDAICLLHLGGLIENTAKLSIAAQQIAESTSTIIVDFTDVFTSPLSRNDCRSKQVRIIETFPPLPLLAADTVIAQARISEPTIEIPIELPKTGSASAIAFLISSSLSGIYYYRKRKYTNARKLKVTLR